MTNGNQQRGRRVRLPWQLLRSGRGRFASIKAAFTRLARRMLRLREDDGGFSTLGMVIALTLSLLLMFSGFRVYRVQTLSADIQEVADVSALAAEGQISTFVSVARVCDAVVLSLTLAGVCVGALGVAALCTPVTSSFAEGLLQAAHKLFSLRDSFSRQAAEGLALYQECLPVLATVQAGRVAAANDAGDEARYLAVAILEPFSGEAIEGFGHDGQDNAQETLDDVEEHADEIRESSDEAERLSRECEDIKRQAWLLDCGSEGHNLRERAEHLASLPAAANPVYRSVDAWSFNVPIERCRAYYARRLAVERSAPSARNAEEQADAVLRARMYEYAVEVFTDAYAYETDEGFRCYFPLLPRNMAELRETELYTERVYPLSIQDNGDIMMHAPSCPRASGCTAKGSIALLATSTRATCDLCKFTPYSLADVCAATSVIGSGFEYYYRQIAQLAEQYESRSEEAQRAAQPAKRGVGSALDALGELLDNLGGSRIAVKPPGSYGAIVIVVNCAETPVDDLFSSGILAGGTSIGMRVAVSAATLVEDDREGADSVITGMTSTLGLQEVLGVAAGGGTGSRVLDAVLGLWSGLLGVYESGQEGLEQSMEDALNRFSWRSSGGLGTWAVKRIQALISRAGLQPAKTSYLRAVLVNTSAVAGAEDSAFSQTFLSVKSSAQTIAQAGEYTNRLGDMLSYARQDGGQETLPEGGIVVSVSEDLLGDGSPLSIVFTLVSGDEKQQAEAAEQAFAWVTGSILSFSGRAQGLRDWR